MMNRAACVLIVILVSCGPVAAQDNRLGDVAGKITLDPEAVVEKRGVVEDPRTAVKADTDLLGRILASCSARADRLGELVTEARATFLTEGSDVQVRLRNASLELDTELQEIALLRLSGAFAQPLSTARTAAGICDEAGESVRTELARGGIAFSEANELIARCRALLLDAEAELAAVSGSEAPKGEGSPADAEGSSVAAEGSPDEIIAELCEGRSPDGETAVESCRSRQYRALAAIESRSAGSEMIDELSFDGVRRLCASEHPQDFVGRDQCEVERMTALRLELE